MTEVDKHKADTNLEWFRELLHKTIGWGIATLLITGGWFATGSGSEMNLNEPGGVRDKTIGYLVISWISWTGWIYATVAIWKKCARHATIPRAHTLLLLVVFLTIMKAVLDWFVAKD